MIRGERAMHPWLNRPSRPKSIWRWGKATHKSEYVNGHIFAMAGASLEHNTFNMAVEQGAHSPGVGRVRPMWARIGMRFPLVTASYAGWWLFSLSSSDS